VDADGALLLLRGILAAPAVTPTWFTLVTSALGGLVGGALTLFGVLITQHYTDRREKARFDRESEREQARWDRDDAVRSNERMQQRLADSYLELLRIVEREGQWIEVSITNWKIGIEELTTCGIDAVINNEETGFKRVKMPPEPAVTDRATIAAHLAAFGSPKVRGLHQDWRSLTTAIDTELDMLDFNASVNYPEISISLDDLKRLDELGTQERAARQELADGIVNLMA
jgi:hypothetical protein